MYEGKLVRLRELRECEVAQCLKWMNCYDTVRLIAPGRMPITEAAEQEYFRSHGADTFGVEIMENGRYIGNCSFFDMDEKARSCCVGWVIGDESARGMGYGSDMIITLLMYLFRHRNMQRVALQVFEWNARAAALYERLGFVREAVYREHVYAEGRYWDEYCYSMLREEFEDRYGDR